MKLTTTQRRLCEVLRDGGSFYFHPCGGCFMNGDHWDGDPEEANALVQAGYIRTAWMEGLLRRYTLTDAGREALEAEG